MSRDTERGRGKNTRKLQGDGEMGVGRETGRVRNVERAERGGEM